MNISTLTIGAPLELWTTRYGAMIGVDATDNDNAVRSLQHYGEWAEKELDVLSSFVIEGQHVLQVGAEHGAHPLWFARTVERGGRVHVVDPSRLALQEVVGNAILNRLHNVYTHQFRAAAAEGRRRGDNGQDEELSNSIDSLKLERLDVLKSNVKDDLLGVLNGAADTVRRCHPLIYARTSGIENVEAEVRKIKEFGYRCWAHTPYLHNLQNFRGETGNIFPARVWQNVVAAPIGSSFELDAQHEL